ncbi:helix-turn-helix domain-containing protein [Verrucomicrobiaceae bacterium N1E253]|uniref:Helix-turn-helix domain-containing protein n=1 Tax=Oceaniferula marina TaxID=2748318 RepID=A0A851GAM0_9BACT|nr:helix-turn-helix domain-containing protein [Oceaniferula marina]NWK54663.1 helix-turn-helix domain-containing protein [Oceaniferula marina]
MQTDVCFVTEMVFQDPQHFASVVKGACIEPCQLSHEPTFSELLRVDFGVMCLDWVKAGSAMLYRGEMPSDSYTMSFVVECEEEGHSFNFETDFVSGYMGFFPPGAKLDATNPAGAINALLTVREDVFREALKVYVPEMDQLLSGGGFGMEVGRINQEHLRSLLGAMRRAVESYDKQSVKEIVCRELGRFLLPTYLAALREGLHRGGVKSLGRVLTRYKKFCATRDYILDHIREPLFVEDLCKSAHLSERGVENLFKDMVGTGPVAFLRLQRLQSVHHALLQSDPEPGKVKQLALEAGFSHMGHFSTYYQTMFGESAGQTLARRCEDLDVDGPLQGDEGAALSASASASVL